MLTDIRLNSASSLFCLFLMILAAILSWAGFGLFDREFYYSPDAFNAWFNADTPRVVDTLINRDAEGHGIAYKHPIFSIILWPPVQIIRLVVSDEIEAIRVLLAVNASLCVYLLWSLLRKYCPTALDAFLCGLLFISSSAFLFWFTVPETYPFACTSILASLCILVLKNNENRRTFIYETLLCAASLTITITNWSIGIASILVRHNLVEWPLSAMVTWMGGTWADRWQKVRRPFWIISSAFGLVLVFAFIQNALFDYASLFVNIGFLTSESRFFAGLSIVELPNRIFDLLVGPMVAGNLFITNPEEVGREYFHIGISNTMNLDNLAWFVTAGWICIMALSVHAIYSSKVKDQLILVVTISLFGFLVLHSIYGKIYFLYSANFLPLLVLFASFGFRSEFKNVTRVAFLIVICAGFFNNFDKFQKAVSMLPG